MNPADMWAVAQVCYAVTGMATAGIAWGVRRTQQPRHERLVLLWALIALALHYGAATVDAALQGRLVGHDSVTLWTATAQLLLITFWALLVLFFVHVIRSVLGPVVDSIRVTLPAWTVVFVNAVAVAYGFIAGFARTDGDLTFPEVVRAPTLYAVFATGLSFALYPAYDALPESHRTTWTRWLSGHALGWRMAVPRGHLVGRRADLKVLFSIYGTALLLIAITFLGESAPWTSPRVALVTVCRVLVLPSIVGLLYFQARVLVFDVMVKQTITFAAVAATLTLLWLVGVYGRGLRPSSGEPLLCAAAILLVYIAGRLMPHVDHWLDAQLFRRPRYDVELGKIVDLMARAETVSTLRAVVTGELSRVFGATSVEYAPEPVADSEFTLPVGAGGDHRGYLSFGLRPRGQYFRSEEQRFIQQVAAQFAARLASFEAQASRVLATEAEWKALRAHINPHFLFNTLNTLAEMAAGHPAVERTVLNLGHVCRHALTSTELHYVPVRAEIEAIRAYLDVERERFEDRLRVSIDVAPDVADDLMPPMLIQPLVENAVKHGIGRKVPGGTVRVTVDRCDGVLRVVVSDDGIGFDPIHAVTGVGLANVRARVAAVGGKVEIRSTPRLGTDVVLTLPSVES